MLKIEPNDATCNACIIASLGISVTTIAESTVYWISTLLTLKLNTTIGGHCDLSVVQCCCFFDLLLDEGKCVHLSLPEILGIFSPVPSVVCVPVTLRFGCFPYGLNQLNLYLRR